MEKARTPKNTEYKIPGKIKLLTPKEVKTLSKEERRERIIFLKKRQEELLSLYKKQKNAGARQKINKRILTIKSQIQYIEGSTKNRTRALILGTLGAAIGLAVAVDAGLFTEEESKAPLPKEVKAPEKIISDTTKDTTLKVKETAGLFEGE